MSKLIATKKAVEFLLNLDHDHDFTFLQKVRTFQLHEKHFLIGQPQYSQQIRLIPEPDGSCSADEHYCLLWRRLVRYLEKYLNTVNGILAEEFVKLNTAIDTDGDRAPKITVTRDRNSVTFQILWGCPDETIVVADAPETFDGLDFPMGEVEQSLLDTFAGAEKASEPNTTLEAYMLGTTHDEYLRRHASGTRYGQWLMNDLHECRLDIHEKIKRTPADCYYDDKKINAFWHRVSELWDK